MKGVFLNSVGILGYSPPQVANRKNTKHIPYLALTGICNPIGNGFQGFCLEWGIDFITFCLISDCSITLWLNRI